MKIVNNLKKVHFEELQQGEVFRAIEDLHLYIKTERYQSANAANVLNGDLTYFGPEAGVYPVECELVIKQKGNLNMAKYIKCSHCNKKVPFGQFVYMENDDESGDVYCSPQCVIDSYGGALLLTEAQADYWGFAVHDDSKRRKEIEAEMAKLQKELEQLVEEHKQYG